MKSEAVQLLGLALVSTPLSIALQFQVESGIVFESNRVNIFEVHAITSVWPIGQGVRRFEMFEFLSEKINFTALGGSKSSSFEPDTSHP